MSENEMIKFTYLKQPPRRYTFEQPALKRWVESWCKGKVLNLFAGKVKLQVDEIRVDIDKTMPADYHIDAYKFVQTWKGVKFDTIILDPPYNIRKAREKYRGFFIGKFTKLKNILYTVLNPGGRIITLGYDSVGMSKIRGFKKIAICLVCHSGDHNDTIVLVEETCEICGACWYYENGKCIYLNDERSPLADSCSNYKFNGDENERKM